MVAVPFKGTFQGSDTATSVTETTSTGITSVTGIATLLGHFSMTQDVVVNLENFTDAGEANWVAANGDVVHTTFEGFAIPDGVAGLTVTETHTITGGTGRFEGAQGTFTVVRTHIFAVSDDGTHVTFGSFEGTITSPGTAQ